MLTIKQVACDIQKVGNILIPSSVLLALHEVCVFNSTMKDWESISYPYGFMVLRSCLVRKMGLE